VDPLGDVAMANKLAHNTVLAVAVLVLLAMGARALRGTQERASTATRH
jgi:hypothetical protein